MKAIYSLYTPPGSTDFAYGFSTVEDHAATMALSVELAKKQFERVELVADTAGKAFAEKYKIGFDSISTTLDKLHDKQLDPKLWAYAKIYACSLQKEPFVHIDGDCLLFEDLPPACKSADMFFFGEDANNNGGYRAMSEHYFNLTKQKRTSPPLLVYNCGVIGANKLKYIDQWNRIAHEYIFAMSNKVLWQHPQTNAATQNFFFEQYFIAQILHESKAKVEILVKESISKPAYKAAHLMGEKRNAELIERIKVRLFREYPFYQNHFTELSPAV